MAKGANVAAHLTQSEIVARRFVLVNVCLLFVVIGAALLSNTLWLLIPATIGTPIALLFGMYLLRVTRPKMQRFLNVIMCLDLQQAPSPTNSMIPLTNRNEGGTTTANTFIEPTQANQPAPLIIHHSYQHLQNEAASSPTNSSQRSSPKTALSSIRGSAVATGRSHAVSPPALPPELPGIVTDHIRMPVNPSVV